MIQCALNGAYTAADHPAVPVTLEEIAADARACQAAGAASVHFHPHRREGGDSMAGAVLDAVVAAVREAVPGLELSCSTHADIDLGGAPDHRAAVRGWTCPPDAVSLNLAEPGSFELGSELLSAGVAIEAGVFTLADADALLAAPWAEQVRRVLVEVIYEHDDEAAVALAHAIDERVAPLGRPRLGTATRARTGRSPTRASRSAATSASGSRTRSSAATAAPRRPTPSRSRSTRLAGRSSASERFCARRRRIRLVQPAS